MCVQLVDVRSPPRLIVSAVIAYFVGRGEFAVILSEFHELDSASFEFNRCLCIVCDVGARFEAHTSVAGSDER